MANGALVFRYYSIEQSICVFVIWQQWEWRAAVLLHSVTMSSTIAAASENPPCRNRTAVLLTMRLTPVARLIIIAFANFHVHWFYCLVRHQRAVAHAKRKYTNLHTIYSRKIIFAVESIDVWNINRHQCHSHGFVAILGCLGCRRWRRQRHSQFLAMRARRQISMELYLLCMSPSSERIMCIQCGSSRFGYAFDVN